MVGRACRREGRRCPASGPGEADSLAGPNRSDLPSWALNSAPLQRTELFLSEGEFPTDHAGRNPTYPGPLAI